MHQEQRRKKLVVTASYCVNYQVFGGDTNNRKQTAQLSEPDCTRYATPRVSTAGTNRTGHVAHYVRDGTLAVQLTVANCAVIFEPTGK
jgi:hypothetical protein